MEGYCCTLFAVDNCIFIGCVFEYVTTKMITLEEYHKLETLLRELMPRMSAKQKDEIFVEMSRLV